MSGRIMGVDPGDVRIGLAMSDPSGTIANPLQVIRHGSRLIDSAMIAQLAEMNGVMRIIVGCSYEMDGSLGPQGRKSMRLLEAIRTQTNIEVELWDESQSTQQARSARIAMGVSRKKRSGHLDELAATIILQSYLDAHT